MGMAMRQTRKPKLVQIGRKGTFGQIREIQCLFFFIFYFYFFPDSPTEVTRRPILHNGSNYVESRKDGLLCGPHDGRPDLGVKFPKNLQKEGVVQKSQAKSEKNENFNNFKTE